MTPSTEVGTERPARSHQSDSRDEVPVNLDGLIGLGAPNPPALPSDIDSKLAAIVRSDFTDEARRAVRERVRTFEEDLITSAITAKKESRADRVSVIDVSRAGDHLAAKTRNVSVLRTYFGVTGGILAGIGASSVVSMLLEGKFSTATSLVAAVCSAIGWFLVALGIDRR